MGAQNVVFVFQCNINFPKSLSELLGVKFYKFFGFFKKYFAAL